MNSTKIITGIGIFTAWALIVSILITAFISVENRNNLGLVTGSAINPQTSSKIDNSLINYDKLLNLDEISKHNSINDCWLLINDKVYDVTSYVSSHPGGQAILSGCGKDATKLYTDVGHSSYADSLFTNYYIGNLNDYTINKENSSNKESNNVLEDSNKSNSNNSQNQENNSIIKDNSNNNNNLNTNKKYTLSVISKHNSINDCWLLINDKVYDVTSYVSSHPGGQAILSGCGKDATSMYNNVGHSSYADSLFTNYYIGDLKKTEIVENTQESQNNNPKNNKNNNSNNNPNNNQNQNNQLQSNNNKNKTNNNQNIPTNENSNSNKKYTLSEVSKYNSANNCYLIINNKVYDVTSYLFSHPAGSAQIIPYCGKDATSIYNAIGHSSYASSLLTAYNMGEISSSSGSSSSNPSTNPSTTPSTNPSTNPNTKPKVEIKEDDEDEDDKYQTENEDKKEVKEVKVVKEDKEEDEDHEKEYEYEDKEDVEDEEDD